MKKINGLAVVIALMLLMTAAIPKREAMQVLAAPGTASSTQEKIDQTTEEKNELEGLLDGTKGNLDNLKNTQQTLRDELDNLNAQLGEIAQKLAEYEKDIKALEQEIADTQVALDEAKAAEEKQYQCMVIRVRDMYERNDSSYLDAIINAGSLGEMLNVADYFEKIASYDRRMLDEL
ncbi:MAG: hypothetical protein IJ833_00595 [Lachnospiraceae bacterium]|nr:hypothetical protein [Lachnospiraceae bacterium]